MTLSRISFKNIIAILLFEIIFVFVFVVAVFIFAEVFIVHSASYIKEGLAAFMGAFFAFLFLRISEWLTRVYDREVKDYNGLVKLEQALITKLHILVNNALLIKKHKASFKDAKEKGVISYNAFNFDLLPVHDEILLEIADVTLINDLFRYNEALRRANSDMSAVDNSLSDLSRYCRDNKDTTTYFHIIDRIEKDALDVLKKFFDDELFVDTFNLFAKSRVLNRQRRPLFTKALLWFRNLGYFKELSSEIWEEKKKIQDEYKQSQKRNKK